jgi:carbon monoxide dehydrogenase subunit G
MKADAKASAVINAQAEQIFRVLLDPDHHRQILPDAFSNYGPEDSDAKLIRFSLKIGLYVRHFRAQVKVLEPDRVLHEVDLSNGIATQFILEPVDTVHTLVTIQTSWQTGNDISGLIEAKLAPLFLRNLYQQELQKLSQHMQKLKASEATLR